MSLEWEQTIVDERDRVPSDAGEQTWIVLADPAGNEFCVLGSRAL